MTEDATKLEYKGQRVYIYGIKNVQGKFAHFYPSKKATSTVKGAEIVTAIPDGYRLKKVKVGLGVAVERIKTAAEQKTFDAAKKQRTDYRKKIRVGRIGERKKLTDRASGMKLTARKLLWGTSAKKVRTDKISKLMAEVKKLRAPIAVSDADKKKADALILSANKLLDRAKTINVQGYKRMRVVKK